MPFNTRVARFWPTPPASRYNESPQKPHAKRPAVMSIRCEHRSPNPSPLSSLFPQPHPTAHPLRAPSQDGSRRRRRAQARRPPLNTSGQNTAPSTMRILGGNHTSPASAGNAATAAQSAKAHPANGIRPESAQPRPPARPPPAHDGIPERRDAPPPFWRGFSRE